MSITKDYLPKHPDIIIYQNDEMFRMNTDTAVLGEFLEVFREDTVLDIGTNQGALLLYASLFHPKQMTGIDINPYSLELAQKNMEVNHIENVTFVHVDACEYRGETVDVIICNPPYFQTKPEEKGKNPYLALAKHEGNLTLQKLMDTIEANLKPNGKVFFLYQASRLHEVMDAFTAHHMQVKILQFVYDVEKESSNVTLIKAMKGVKSGLVVLKPIIIDRQKARDCL